MLAPFVSRCHLEHTLLLPHTLDALVMMYSDMEDLGEAQYGPLGFDPRFEQRWSDIARRAPVEDPELAAILPVVRSRAYDACALVHSFVTSGYNADALRSFRSTYAPLARRRDPSED
jgi:hypothetical protein